MQLSRRARHLFNAKRFAIATLLYIYGRATMAWLRRETGLSWGDLDSNVRSMAREGIVRVWKDTTVEGPRTFVELTPEGRKAYEELAAYLETVLDGTRRGRGRGGPPGPS